VSPSHPPPPKADLSIADYLCITEPCYGISKPYRPPSSTGGLFGLPSGTVSQRIREVVTTGQVEPTIAALPPWLVDQDLGDSVYVPEEIAPAPSQSVGISEVAAINPARPVIQVTSAERDQFYADRASILARFPGYVAGAESDPVFIIREPQTYGKVPSPVTGTSPPPLLQDVGQSQTGANGGFGAVAGTAPEGRVRSGFEEQPMGWLDDGWDLVKGTFDFDPATPGIFGSSTEAPLTSIPDLLGGVYRTYQANQLGRVASIAPAPLPPYINPTTRVTPTNVTPMRTSAVGCISQRDIDIAAATGTTPELVDVILKLGRRNRRRKRMLTKSDIGDISTMRQILGGGEAFKVWLAKATR